MGTFHRWDAEKIDEIRRMRQEGKSFGEIAPHFGVTQGAVSQAWHKRANYKSVTKREYNRKPESITFQIPEPTKSGQIAIVLIQPNQLKQVMEDLWR